MHFFKYLDSPSPLCVGENLINYNPKDALRYLITYTKYFNRKKAKGTIESIGKFISHS